MILIINICGQEMHYHEFVSPIEDILNGKEEPFITKRYVDVNKKDLESSHRIIIAGTSLKDSSYLKHISKFKFLKSYAKPVLAICGGMQILCMIHGCRLFEGKEIGLKSINFNAEFLKVTGSREVYELHNFAIREDENLKKNFHIYSKSIIEDQKGKTTGLKGKSEKEIVQAVKHRHLKHYGVLFHPEVRNKDMIVNFLYV
ncbi:MAG: glutamine amidotransferase-related protein [Candidatus Woesearchaeota archaeon]